MHCDEFLITDSRTSLSTRTVVGGICANMGLTLSELEHIREEAMAEDVQIDLERMSGWTRAEAERYFENGGEEEHELTAWLRRLDCLRCEASMRHQFATLGALQIAVSGGGGAFIANLLKSVPGECRERLRTALALWLSPSATSAIKALAHDASSAGANSFSSSTVLSSASGFSFSTSSVEGGEVCAPR